VINGRGWDLEEGCRLPLQNEFHSMEFIGRVSSGEQLGGTSGRRGCELVDWRLYEYEYSPLINSWQNFSLCMDSAFWTAGSLNTHLSGVVVIIIRSVL
jgi:hypothetical protein